MNQKYLLVAEVYVTQKKKRGGKVTTDARCYLAGFVDEERSPKPRNAGKGKETISPPKLPEGVWPC